MSEMTDLWSNYISPVFWGVYPMSAKHTNSRKTEKIKELTEWTSLIQGTHGKLSFNFKFFTYGDHSGQSFEKWQQEEILADLNNKLKDFSNKSKLELRTDRTLEIYDYIPHDTEFEIPKVFIGQPIKWARLRITGSRRLIGILLPDEEGVQKDIFYVVFLDEDHKFAPYHTKGT